MRHDNFIRSIIEGEIEGKRGRGKPKHSYIDQIKEKVTVVMYKEVKETTPDKRSWIKLHR